MSTLIWQENYIKSRQFVRNVLLGTLTSIITLYAYVYKTIVLKTPTEELLVSQINMLIFTVALITGYTILLYYGSFKISKTFRDEGIRLKDKGASAIEYRMFLSSMKLYYKVISLGSLFGAGILGTLSILLLLNHALGLSSGVIFSGLYFTLVALIYPNIRSGQARKIKFLEFYVPNMSLLWINDLIFKIAMAFKGKIVHFGTRISKDTKLSRDIAQSKSTYKRYMYILGVTYFFASILYLSTSASNIDVFGYQVATDTYYISLIMFIILSIVAFSCLYRQVSSGNAKIRKYLSKWHSREKKPTIQKTVKKLELNKSA